MPYHMLRKQLTHIPWKVKNYLKTLFAYNPSTSIISLLYTAKTWTFKKTDNILSFIYKKKKIAIFNAIVPFTYFLCLFNVIYGVLNNHKSPKEP